MFSNDVSTCVNSYQQIRRSIIAYIVEAVDRDPVRPASGTKELSRPHRHVLGNLQRGDSEWGKQVYLPQHAKLLNDRSTYVILCIVRYSE